MDYMTLKEARGGGGGAPSWGFFFFWGGGPPPFEKGRFFLFPKRP